MDAVEKLCLQWKKVWHHISNIQFTLFRRKQENGCCEREWLLLGEEVLWDDKDFTDVTLACEDGKQVEAHKVILAASSPFFSTLSRLCTKTPRRFPPSFEGGLCSWILQPPPPQKILCVVGDAPTGSLSTTWRSCSAAEIGKISLVSRSMNFN